MQDTPDLSKIVNLIMQNPSLIAEISKLANQDTDKDEENASTPEKDAEASLKAVETTGAPKEDRERIQRRELLSALKPYLSEKRRSAIDSMMSMSEIFDIMRKK